MSITGFNRYALTSCVTAALLAGCGPQPPMAAPSAALPAAPLGQPRADLAGRNLLYVSTLGDKPVYVYTYPGGKMIGILNGPIGPRGMCVNRSRDIFTPFIYIPGGIYEFAHGGGSPIAYLGFPYDGENGCSVDPTNGDLAVVGGPDFYPALVVYRNRGKHGWGFAKSIALTQMESSAFCGYDKHGNLFVDGKDSSGAFVLAELAKGSKTATPISVSQTITSPGQVQWDGQHLTIGDTGVSPSVIYQFDVSGSTATEVGSTVLKGSTMVEQFWIQGGNVIAPDSGRSCGGTQKGCVAIYRYPAGGSAVKTIELTGAFGATVSLEPSR
ncbi:MAG TPA: hypothetical protein VGX91_11960 [Candidatus Cybelea sp.]|nr:hypothetical protein [Candidatus Cybelea sp.]